MNKYKKPDQNCPDCKGGGLIISKAVGHGDEYNHYYNKYRCSCTLREKKSYAKYKKRLRKLSALLELNMITNQEFRKQLKKLNKMNKDWKDNNEKYNTVLASAVDY